MGKIEINLLENLYTELDDEGVEFPCDLAQVLRERDLPEWQQEMLLEADEIERGYHKRYVGLPEGDTYTAYDDMEDFIFTVQDDALRDRLFAAIRGRGAFRRFKDLLYRHPREQERWFAFEDERTRRRVYDWFASQDIDAILVEATAQVDPGPPARVRLIAESDQGGARFGCSVGAAGDVNGDGYADVIVGAYYYDNDQTNEGRAFVYHGSTSGLAADPAWTAEGDQDHANLGWSVGTAGDVNGDGYADAIVGTPWYDNGETEEGRAFVYHGSASGLSHTSVWTVESNQPIAGLGSSVGTAGDVNGDGYADVIVGAYHYDSKGRAFLYYGNGGDGLHLRPRQVRTDGADPPGPLAPIAHLGMSDSGTAFRLSLIGRSPAGREDVRLQYQVAPLGTPFTATEAISGTSGWTDVLTTGVEIAQIVGGLTPGTPYHWRVRLLYHPGNALGLPASRWVHIPWAGWNETDLRTRPNQPPVADAGSDQSVNTLALVTLDGSGSSDPDSHLPLTYHWAQIGGPTVTLNNPAAVAPTFSAPGSPAVLTFSLVVTDSLGLPDPTPDEVVITVEGYRICLPLILRSY